MGKNKEKMEPLKKAKLLYSGELLLFAAIFVVLGVLFLTKVINVADWKKWAFLFVTLAGSLFLNFTLVWALVSRKRREKVCLLDKLLLAPVSLFLPVFDIYALVTNLNDIEVFRLVMGIDFIYLSIIYLFQAIYHYYRPLKMLIDAVEEEEKEENEKQVHEG